MYVSSAVAVDDVRAAVAALPKPAGVSMVVVDDTAAACLGHHIAVDLFGPDADLRADGYASRLAQKLSASVMTGPELDDQLRAAASLRQA